MISCSPLRSGATAETGLAPLIDGCLRCSGGGEPSVFNPSIHQPIIRKCEAVTAPPPLAISGAISMLKALPVSVPSGTVGRVSKLYGNWFYTGQGCERWGASQRRRGRRGGGGGEEKERRRGRRDGGERGRFPCGRLAERGQSDV